MKAVELCPDCGRVKIHCLCMKIEKIQQERTEAKTKSFCKGCGLPTNICVCDEIAKDYHKI